VHINRRTCRYIVLTDVERCTLSIVPPTCGKYINSSPRRDSPSTVACPDRRRLGRHTHTRARAAAPTRSPRLASPRLASPRRQILSFYAARIRNSTRRPPRGGDVTAVNAMFDTGLGLDRSAPPGHRTTTYTTERRRSTSGLRLAARPHPPSRPPACACALSFVAAVSSVADRSVAGRKRVEKLPGWTVAGLHRPRSSRRRRWRLWSNGAAHPRRPPSRAARPVKAVRYAQRQGGVLTLLATTPTWGCRDSLVFEPANRLPRVGEVKGLPIHILTSKRSPTRIGGSASGSGRWRCPSAAACLTPISLRCSFWYRRRCFHLVRSNACSTVL